MRLQSLTSNWSGADHPATLFEANSTTSGNTSYGPVGLLYAQLGIPSGSQTAEVTQTRGYDNRGRITNDVYNASAVNSTAATKSTGVITITPFNGSDSSTAHAGNGSVTISGTEQSTVINPCEPHSSCPTTIYDSGTVTVTINGTKYMTGYGEGMTSSALASNLASTISGGSLVNATTNGTEIILTAKTTGSSTNYSLSATSATSNPAYFSGPSFTANTSGSSLTGGSSGDTGTVSATINGCTGSYSWGATDTASTVASGLKASIASQCSSSLTTSVSGSTVSLTSLSTGSSTNWPVSVIVTNTNSSYPSAFFSAAASGMSGGTNAGIGSVMAYSYKIPSGGYDAANNVRTVIDSAMGTWNYTYDTLNRLSTATASSGTYVGNYGCWTYDGFGDRTMESIPSTIACNNSPTPTYWAHYNTSNQVTGTGLMTAGYTYDAAGDITADGQNAYLYDGAGRICAVKNLNSGVMTQYIYDGEGNRVAKGTLSSWPTACQAPTSGNGFSLNVQYVIGLGGEQLTELQANNAWSHTNVFGGGGLLATYSGADTIYALTDWQGTKRGETSAGGCLGSWSSLPFGNDLTQAGNCVDASEHHYTGKVRDSETGYSSGNDDFGARYYASSIGHWLSPDWAASAEAVPYASYGSPQTLNLYAFVGNNPLSDADPDGHSSYGEQMMCSNGPNGGQCGVGTDPFASGSTGMGPEMGCDTEGGEHCTPNMQETSYNAWLGAAQKAQEAAQQQNGQQGIDNSLKYKTVTGGQKQGPWEINWSLKHNSKKGGFIVQHIVADFGDAGHFDYYEAWPVAPGTHTPSIQGVDGNGNLYSDMFSGPAGSHIHGSARFYEGLNLPDSFTVHPPGFPAGILRSTTTNPNLPTDNATAPNVRWWGIP